MRMYLDNYDKAKFGKTLNEHQEESDQSDDESESVASAEQIQQNFDGPIMDLENNWKEKRASKNEYTNTHFWLHHLDSHIKLLTKREYSLYDFKNTDSLKTRPRIKM